MRPRDGCENNVIYYISLLARAQYLIEKFVSETETNLLTLFVFGTVSGWTLMSKVTGMD